jgi:rod shape-determining protein MreB
MSDTVFIGIDLGTSRTSIATSTGHRETVWSYVGYPRDHVARKRFGGRDVIYGKEALDGRLALELYRPMAGSAVKRRGAQDDSRRRKAMRDLIHHAIDVARIPHGSTIYGMIGAPAEASIEGKASILEMVKGSMDSAIICSEPYAVAYGLDFIDDTLVIDCGAGTTDLCRLHGTMPKPEDQRTHEIAGDSIDQELAQLIKDRFPQAQFSINMVRDFKEKHSSVSRHMDPAIVTMPVAGRPQQFDITELVYKACYTLVPPTVTALQELIATYDPEFQEKMRSHILLGGGGSVIKGLGLAIEQALKEYGGGHVTTVDEPQHAGASGALKFALDMPQECWKEFQNNNSLEMAVI